MIGSEQSSCAKLSNYQHLFQRAAASTVALPLSVALYFMIWAVVMQIYISLQQPLTFRTGGLYQVHKDHLQKLPFFFI